MSKISEYEDLRRRYNGVMANLEQYQSAAVLMRAQLAALAKDVKVEAQLLLDTIDKDVQ